MFLDPFLTSIMAERICCCISNLLAVKILAIIFAVLHVIQLGITAYGLANFNDIIDIIDNYVDEGDAGDDVEKVRLLFRVVLIVSLGICGVNILVDLCLLVGAFKKVPCLLWFWLVVNAVSIVYTLISAILTFTVMNIVVAACSILLTVWAMLAVYGSIQEIKEEQQDEKDFYDNQAKDF